MLFRITLTLILCVIVRSLIPGARLVIPGVKISKIVKDVPYKKVLTEATEDGVKDFIKSSASTNKVVLVSKNYCPKCMKIKKAFASFNVPYLSLELDAIEHGSLILDVLKKQTGKKTLPYLYINSKLLENIDKMIRQVNFLSVFEKKLMDELNPLYYKEDVQP